MGTSKSASEFARKIEAAGLAVQRNQRKVVNEAALLAKRELESSFRTAVGVDMRMSGVGRRGAKLGIGFDVKGVNNPTALVKARGPAHLIENPTSAHQIPKARGRRRAVRRVRLPDGGVRRSVWHPGTKGKQPWRKGVERAEPKVVKLMKNQLVTGITRPFR